MSEWEKSGRMFSVGVCEDCGRLTEIFNERAHLCESCFILDQEQRAHEHVLSVDFYAE